MTAIEQQARPVEMEETPCEICGSDERRLVAWRPDLMLGGDRLFYMHECRGCGVLYQHPRPAPDAMEAFYPPEYQPYTPKLEAEGWLRRLDRRYGLRKRCHAVTRRVPRGRLLDVGCATGDFLDEMRRVPGWSVVGIEPGAAAARYARLQQGLDVVEGTLNDSPFADRTFDAVTVWDVLEHVYDPRAVIRSLARLLRPGGVLVINYHNLRAIDRRLFGRFWCGYELPRHLYLFPDQLLGSLLAEHGLHEVERQCLYGSQASTTTTLQFLARTYLEQGVADRVHDLLYSKIVRLVCLPYFYVTDRLLLGSNVTAVYRKADERNVIPH